MFASNKKKFSTNNFQNYWGEIRRALLFLLFSALTSSRYFYNCDAFLLSERPFRYTSAAAAASVESDARAPISAAASNSRESGNLDAANGTRANEILSHYNRHVTSAAAATENRRHTVRNLCYCSYGVACDYSEICVKHEMAACFHAVRQIYSLDASENNSGYSSGAYGREDEEKNGKEAEVPTGGFMQTQHFYGCAPYERGTNASHLTCNSWRSVHGTPTSIACCYEGNLCNMNVTPTSHNRFRPNYSINNNKNNNNRDEDEADDEQLAFSNLLFQINMSRGASGGSLLAAALSMAVGCAVGSALLFLVLFLVLPVLLRRHERYVKKKFPRWLWSRLDASFGDRRAKSAFESGAKDEHLLRAGGGANRNAKTLPNENALDFDTTGSGSGSGGVTLNQRTIALDLLMLETVARGRYGEVRKALYRGSIVAVKTFYTTEEESWKNERDIYQTQMLNHENILQYVAADISSNVESLTQMMLVTDYHPHGSLYDYLRELRRGCAVCINNNSNTNNNSNNKEFNGRVVSASNASSFSSAASTSAASGAFHHQRFFQPTSYALLESESSASASTTTCHCFRMRLDEALQIAFSIISGVEHLHNAVRGTGSRRKPEIAHRDIKSKNVIVKRPGVCCVADFGLAVRHENNAILPERINVQVGTKRYMAPEVLARSLNVEDFDAFKAADIYSYALVLWEVLQLVELDEHANKHVDHSNVSSPAAQICDRQKHQNQLQQQHYPHSHHHSHPQQQHEQQQQQQQQQQRRVISRSSSSGIATGASDRSTSYLISNRHNYYPRYRSDGLGNRRQQQQKQQQQQRRRNFRADEQLPYESICRARYNNEDISKSESSEEEAGNNTNNALDDSRGTNEPYENTTTTVVQSGKDRNSHHNINSRTNYTTGDDEDDDNSDSRSDCCDDGSKYVFLPRTYASANATPSAPPLIARRRPSSPINAERDKRRNATTENYSDDNGSVTIVRQNSPPSERNNNSNNTNASNVVMHRLPYQDIIESDPSLEDMYRIVCEAKLRPILSGSALNHPIMARLCELMRECWSENAKSRHTSLKVKKELADLVATSLNYQSAVAVSSSPSSLLPSPPLPPPPLTRN